jgi:hypothetical protein
VADLVGKYPQAVEALALDVTDPAAAERAMAACHGGVRVRDSRDYRRTRPYGHVDRFVDGDPRGERTVRGTDRAACSDLAVDRSGAGRERTAP